MNASLKLLSTTRKARRESALSQFALAQREFAAAQALNVRAIEALGQALAWSDEVKARCALGKEASLRNALMPACSALIQQREVQCAQTQVALSQAHEHIVAQRQRVIHCEKETLRVDEWRALAQAQTQRAQARQESQQDEELSSRPSHSHGAR